MTGEYPTPVSDRAWLAEQLRQIRAEVADANRRAGQGATREALSSGLQLLDNYVRIPVAIPTGADLDDYDAQGVYHQDANAWAAAGSNYPEDVAGLLEVFENVSGGFVYQRYSTYQASAHVWHRTRYVGTWSAWQRVVAEGEPGTIRAMASGSYSSGSDLSSGSGASVSRTFPAGRFPSAPRVVCNPTASARITMAATAVTTSGFTARLDNWSGGTATDRDFDWIAVLEWT